MAQIPMTPVPVKLPPHSQLASYPPWEVLYDHFTEEEKIEAWFPNDSAQHSGTIECEQQ